MTTRHASQSSSADLRERARMAVSRQPARTVTVLSSLLAAQDEIGYLPPEAIEEVAATNGETPNAVWGVASFYPNFRFTPPARHLVEVCWGPTCHTQGAQPLLQGLLKHLNLEHEGETADDAITLKMNTCLGVCPHAPAMSFDHELAGRMQLNEATRRVELLRAETKEVRRSKEADEAARREEAERRSRARRREQPNEESAG